MIRREFLSLSGAALLAQKKNDKKAAKGAPPPPPPPGEQVRTLFLQIVDGYIAAARKTSPSLAVVEFANATVTPNFLAQSKLSVTGVTRMLPALAAWVAGGREPRQPALEALVLAYTNGTDPKHADYWGASPAKSQNQRQVESSIVAWSLWCAREALLPKLTAEARRNVNAWLASCTQVPVRGNNWAWFTAVNIATRLRLAESHPEFQADAAFMLDDIKAMDAMAAGDSGWYNDGTSGSAFDYYNSWVFASHFLYWNELVGARYPQWREKFATRLKSYLEFAPFFFAGHGGHVLYGRSLIYRWGVLTPFHLAYQQGLWPHSPGLLRRITEQNILWHERLGGFDHEAGKLRESFTPEGTMDVKESYIDGGHPYWGMQAFSFYRLPDNDPYFTAPEEKLPIEKSDFAIALPEPGLLLAGCRQSGHVRIYNARSTRPDAHYRDKYNKLVYSSHFPFCVNHTKDRPTLDQTLSLRNTKTGALATRGPISETDVQADRIEFKYSIRLGAVNAEVHTTLQWSGDFELRKHLVACSGEGMADIELVEAGAAYSEQSVYPEAHIKTWALQGWKGNRTEDAPGSVFWREAKMQTLTAPLQPRMILASYRYQSPKALAKDKVDDEARRALAEFRP